MKRDYIYILAVIVMTFLYARSCNENDEFQISKEFLEEKNSELSTKIHTLQQNNLKLEQTTGKYKDSIRYQDVKITALEKKKNKVVYVEVTPEEVDTTDTEELVREINKGRKCCGELVFANSIISELKTKSLHQEAVIFNQDSLISNLRNELSLVRQKAGNAEKLYQAEIKKLKRQKFVFIGTTVIAIGLIFL